MKYLLVIIIITRILSQVFSQSEFEIDDYRKYHQGEVSALTQTITSASDADQEETEENSTTTTSKSTSTTNATTTVTTTTTSTTTTTTNTTSSTTTEMIEEDEYYYYDEAEEEEEEEEEAVKLARTLRLQYDFLKENKHLDKDTQDQVRI